MDEMNKRGATPNKSLFRRIAESEFFHNYKRSPSAIVGTVIVVLVLFIALFGPLFAPQNPYDVASLSLTDSYKPPAWEAGGDARFIFGTDSQGRDIFSSLIYGSRISLFIGVVGTLLACAVGITLGLISGYFGGRVDAVIMRLADILLSFPDILVALFIMTMFGRGENHNKGKRRTGRMQHTTVYGRLMICQCGNKFNLRFHSRDGRTDGVDYQCYTSVNRGSVAKRLNKGISIEHSCESPYIQGWKLEMMAEQVFDRYIENADKVMDLSYAMLEKHIADQEELPDNIDVIRRKQGEIKKLMNKRTNLIEMRAEGDIDKEMFRSKKQEIEDRVAKLTEEIKGLQPEKEQTSNEDYSVKLLELRERLKEYTGFDYSVIPESIVEAFIERIWVSKDEFRWYLRTGNNADSEFDPDDHIKIGAFTLTINDAKKYIYSFSTRRRVYKWADLNVSVWI